MSEPDLCEENLLGSYEDRDEYQIGRTLVWVEFGSYDQQESATDLACLQFPSIWSAIPEVIAAAREASRRRIPEFWQVHDEAGTSNQLLSVWGIWIEPMRGVATYKVSTNHDFPRRQHPNLPEFDSENRVLVIRSKAGILSVKAAVAPVGGPFH